MSKPRILWVDDEEPVLRAVAASLRSRYDIIPVTSAAAALTVATVDRAIVVIVSDLQMPEMDGLALLAEVRVTRPDIVRILLTGNHARAAEVAEAADDLAFRVLTKPCPRDAMIEAIESALASRSG